MDLRRWNWDGYVIVQQPIVPPGGGSLGSVHDNCEVHTYCAMGHPRILLAPASIAALLRKIEVTDVVLISSIIIVIIVRV